MGTFSFNIKQYHIRFQTSSWHYWVGRGLRFCIYGWNKKGVCYCSSFFLARPIYTRLYNWTVTFNSTQWLVSQWSSRTLTGSWSFKRFDPFLNSWSYVKVAQSCPILCNPQTVACQAPLSMEFSRPEYWSG